MKRMFKLALVSALMISGFAVALDNTDRSFVGQHAARFYAKHAAKRAKDALLIGITGDMYADQGTGTPTSTSIPTSTSTESIKLDLSSFAELQAPSYFNRFKSAVTSGFKSLMTIRGAGKAALGIAGLYVGYKAGYYLGSYLRAQYNKYVAKKAASTSAPAAIKNQAKSKPGSKIQKRSARPAPRKSGSKRPTRSSARPARR